MGAGPVPEPPLTNGCVEDVDSGYLWRRRHAGEDGEPSHWDFLRQDGSLYARTAPTASGPAAVFDREGRIAGSWPTLGGLWRWWVGEMMPAEGRVFILSDSRFITAELVPLVDGRVHVLHQLHNPHLAGAIRWNSSTSKTYWPLMQNVGRLDALITLTGRQRADIRRRYGATNNLFVIPNPVVSQPPPEPRPARRPAAIVMVARLVRQKRIDRAIDAFARLHESLPEATLDIFGDGPLRATLQQQIDDAGLSAAITLHGHDPAAGQVLWTASLSWLTSHYEGYPLATFEAMSQGCPVVSFDVKYGPREQIDHGVDGLLVRERDTAELARVTLELLQDPPRLARMRQAAFTKASVHDVDRFLGDWARVLTQTIKHKPIRTVVDAASWDLQVARLSFPIRLSGTLTLDTHKDADLDGVSLNLCAYAHETEPVVDLPIRFTRSGSDFDFRATVSRKALADLNAQGRILRLRVGFLWNNSAGHAQVLPADFRIPVPMTTRVRRAIRARAGRILRRAGLR